MNDSPSDPTPGLIDREVTWHGALMHFRVCAPIEMFETAD